jgi:hypothetical protein
MSMARITTMSMITTTLISTITTMLTSMITTTLMSTATVILITSTYTRTWAAVRSMGRASITTISTSRWLGPSWSAVRAKESSCSSTRPAVSLET